VNKKLNSAISNARIMLGQNEHVKYMSEKMDAFNPKTENEIIFKDNILELLKMVEESHISLQVMKAGMIGDLESLLSDEAEPVKAVAKSNVIPFVRKNV
jgi:hypothetical protein